MAFVLNLPTDELTWCVEPQSCVGLPHALEIIATYPFTDDAVRETIKGDYAHLYVRGDLNLTTVLENFR